MENQVDDQMDVDGPSSTELVPAGSDSDPKQKKRKEVSFEHWVKALDLRTTYFFILDHMH